jgi:hypothetical protein
MVYYWITGRAVFAKFCPPFLQPKFLMVMSMIDKIQAILYTIPSRVFCDFLDYDVIN